MEEVEEAVEIHLVLDALHAGEDAIVAGAPLVLVIARVRGHEAGLAATDEALEEFRFLDFECDSESVCLAGEVVLHLAEHHREVAEEDVAAAEHKAGMVTHFVDCSNGCTSGNKIKMMEAAARPCRCNDRRKMWW